jgi:DNA repair protein RecO (recombination protein O)
MERFDEQALVLSTLDYGEADRLVTLFTRDHGKLTAFAAGARKSRVRFGGALEPFTLVKTRLVERRGETFRMERADVERKFNTVRQELPLIARALYCLELCRELVRDREPHPALFASLLEYLELLDERTAGPTSLIAFELNALARAGLMPRFDRCTVCAGPAGEAPGFDPDHGGVLCRGCRGRAFHCVAVSPQLMESLSALQSGDRNPLPAPARRAARELLNLFIAHHLGRRLKSVDFMVQVGLD